MSTDLHLVIPDLLPHWTEAGQPGFPLPRAPALSRLLSRAGETRAGEAGLEAAVLRRFGLPAGTRGLGALMRLADGGAADGAYWLCADPVHLRADLHTVHLFDARGLDIRPDEAAQLVAEFNRTFAADGLRLEAPVPERWYLRVEGAEPAFETAPTGALVGRGIAGQLPPPGADGRVWHTRLTEIQMLFYPAAANLAREARGVPAVSSVWLWGGGRLPEPPAAPRAALYGGHPLLKGLARHAGAELNPLPANFEDWRAAAAGEAEAWVLLDALRFHRADGDVFGWHDALERLEHGWFAPLLGALGRGVTRLTLEPGDGRAWTLGRGELRRFWRRTQPLARFFAQGAEP